MPGKIDLPKGLSFGAQLKYIRNLKGISTFKLAELAKIHRNTIRDLEADRYRSTKIETIELLSKALNFYDWELFRDDGIYEIN